MLCCLLYFSGDYITYIDVIIGYLHRGTEKLCEYKTVEQCLPEEEEGKSRREKARTTGKREGNPEGSGGGEGAPKAEERKKDGRGRQASEGERER